jgi:predicted amidohydrolase YtcJ
MKQRTERARSFPKEAAADIILTGGNIITMDSGKPMAQAVAIKGGRFLKVGRDPEAQAFAGSRTEKIDLKGKTVTPGFIDSHQHLWSGPICWMDPCGDHQSIAQSTSGSPANRPIRPPMDPGRGFDDTKTTDKRY